MSFDQLLIAEDLNQTVASSPPEADPTQSDCPDLPSDPPGGKGIVGSVKDDMMVRMNRTLLPLRALKGLRGQRLKPGDLFLLEDLKRLSLV
jgi:hypothetical protein